MTGAVRPLGREALLFLGANVFYKATGLLVYVASTRALSAAALGAWFFTQAASGSLLLLSNLNLGSLVMRRVALAPASAPRELARVVGFRLVSAPIFLAAAIVVGLATTHGRLPWYFVPAVVLADLLEDLYTSASLVFLALRRPALNVAIGVPVQTAWVLSAVIALRWRPGIDTLLVVTLARAAVLLFAGWTVAICKVGVDRPWLDRSFFEGCLPFTFLGLLQACSAYADRLVLGLVGTYAPLAHYQLADQTVASTAFVPAAIGNVAFAPLASSRGRKSPYVLVTVVVALAGLAGAAAMAWLAPPLCSLMYGPQAPHVAPVLRALSPVVPLMFVAHVQMTTLLATRGESVAWKVLAGSAAVSVLGSALLVPQFGVSGAVAARIAAAAVHLSLALAMARRHVGR